MESLASTLTETQREQSSVESEVFQIYSTFAVLPPDDQSVKLEIRRHQHVEFLTRSLRRLGPSFCTLDANRPWLCYWILHPLALMGESVDDDLENLAIEFLSRCEDTNGGYGGGPGQLPHLATTYAAVNSFITIGGYKSLSSINRGKLYTFLLQMKCENGGFRMHDAGEIDVRACYTAISVASILNILDNVLAQNVGDYILSCQTYEGGIAGEPGSEAHGGYTYCGVATMILIDEVNRLDLIRLIHWVAFRQGVECGFQGRTNKLVDGCYSFWQGGVFALLQRLHSIIDTQLGLSDIGGCEAGSVQNNAASTSRERENGLDKTLQGDKPNYEGQLSSIGFDFLMTSAEMEPLFHSIALQQYILLCSQLGDGGFRDKPGKGRDLYHTCYCLSGLSLCQHGRCKSAEAPPLPMAILGPYSNLLEPLHPLHNIVLDRFHEAHRFFSSDPDGVAQVCAERQVLDDLVPHP